MGDEWAYSPETDAESLQVYWVPGDGTFEEAASGSLSVISLDLTSQQATFQYAFQTLGGVSYGGTVTVLVCGPIDEVYFCN
ncbi:MAG: hypothetical protein U0441_31110 [Polyangiaceae bacterium]